MRLYPPVTTQEVEVWLTNQAIERWGPDVAGTLSADITAMATAMAALSKFEFDDEFEPLFP